MRKVEEIERQILGLSPTEFSELRDWVIERDWAQWDEQIESDTRSGKLDTLASEALADHEAGKSRVL